MDHALLVDQVWVPEWVLVWVPEWVPEWVLEWVRVWVRAWVQAVLEDPAWDQADLEVQGVLVVLE